MLLSISALLAQERNSKTKKMILQQAKDILESKKYCY